MFLKFGIASNEIIMRIVLGKSENLQNKGCRRSKSNSGHTPSSQFTVKQTSKKPIVVSTFDEYIR